MERNSNIWAGVTQHEDWQKPKDTEDNKTEVNESHEDFQERTIFRKQEILVLSA
jgi:hypothetical protein